MTAAFAAALVLPLAGCSAGEDGADGPEPPGRPFVAPSPGPSWEPRPRQAAGLTGVASVSGSRFALHTASGDVAFLPGVNLGSTTPGHQPGELAITAADYRRWFSLMGRMGIRSVRVYTIHPPSFYAALAAYNRAHAAHPVYLVQGVYLPDESSYVTSGDLFAAATTTGFDAEIADAVAAVHGDLRRGRTPGRAGGTWTDDVSAWLAGWVVGVEWDPVAVHRNDRHNAGRPGFRGRYFTSTADASATERWLASRLDHVASAMARRGHTAPVAFVNWPTTDPLDHPDEPLANEDLVGVDANHVRATAAWPGGTFASYHAYPYYPDFQRHEPALAGFRWRGRNDPYAGYLAALRRHHAVMPVMVTEFGVPSSVGSAHAGALGRDQGAHSEQQAVRMDARMLRDIHDLGLAGAFLFSWTDEWFKRTWNTEPRQVPGDRRQLWHDPWTNEQHFGLLATDAVGGAEARWRVVHEARAGVREVAVATDESWVHLRVRLDGPLAGPLVLAFDTVPGGAVLRPDGHADSVSDYVAVIDPSGSAQAWVRSPLDPTVLDGLAVDRTGEVRGWRPMRLTTNRGLTVPSTGRHLPAERQDVGHLRRGEMRPGRPGYDSRATWQVTGGRLVVRVPWAQVGLADPSSKLALVPHQDGSATTVPVERIGLVVDAGGVAAARGHIVWEPWNQVHYRERVKSGAQAFVDAMRYVSR